MCKTEGWKSFWQRRMRSKMSNKILIILIGVVMVLMLGLGGGLFMMWNKLSAMETRSQYTAEDAEQGDQDSRGAHYFIIPYSFSSENWSQASTVTFSRSISGTFIHYCGFDPIFIFTFIYKSIPVPYDGVKYIKGTDVPLIPLMNLMRNDDDFRGERSEARKLAQSTTSSRFSSRGTMGR